MANFKITTEAEKTECLMWISDLFKDVNGFRPRGYNFHEWSFEQLADFVNDLYFKAEEEARREKEYSKRCVTRFKKDLQKIKHLGAGDRKTALKWMLQGEMANTRELLDLYTVELFLMERGIDHTDFGRKVEKELIEIVNNNLSDFQKAA
tara:strand:+ start:52 stop:501 length:450 start_codon:yes stop_codon:yes gene_type:complete